MSDRALTYVEIDLLYCELTYSVPPCQAAIGVTGEQPCFNTLGTCQDRDNFTPETVTIRFAVDTDYRPKQIEAFPSIKGWSITPPKISLGEDLGQRGSLNVSFVDHPHSDTGPGGDPYLADRDYNPFDQGTFWGKFRARQPFIMTRPIRIIRGFVPDEFEATYPQGTALPDGVLRDQETRHYLVDHFDGPRPDASYEIVGKDVLKFADGRRGQAPRVSNGFLSSGIDEEELIAILSPSGIGDAEYAASGYVAIGGEEIVGFTRSGDTLTITRGEFGTTPAEHDGQDRVQEVLVYSAADPSEIIADLLENYAEVDSDFIPITEWQEETSSISSVYSGAVAEPTAVADLVSELVKEAGLVIWWDDERRVVRLQALRGIPTSAQVLDETTIVQGSLRTKEQPEKRLSQVWTSFAKRSPLEGQGDSKNFRSTAATVDLEKQSDYNAPAILKINSRWIGVGGRAIAERLNDTFLSRFRDPPRNIQFEVFRGTPIVLGGGYRVAFWPFQDETGARATVPIQVTRLEPTDTGLLIEAEEMLFEDFAQSEEHLIVFDADINNVNLRTVHDQLYEPVDGTESPSIPVIALVTAGTIIGSNSTELPAFNVGSWPAGVIPHLTIEGRIQGAGGKGGRGGNKGGSGGQSGNTGGTALLTTEAITLSMPNGEIYAGAGGGGGGGRSDNNAGHGGSGGAGTIPGGGGGGGGGDPNARSGKEGSSESGGAVQDASGAFSGGRGGDPGENGASGSGSGAGAGGTRGFAIDGVSLITILDAGDVRGRTQN